MTNTEIYIWADGSYHLADDGEPPSWKSDDYLILDIEGEDIDCLDEWVHLKLTEVNLGSCTETKTLMFK